MLKITNSYTHLDKETQKSMCGEKLVELFLKERGIELKQEPSLNEEIKEDSKGDIILENLKKISDNLMEKYGTVILPDFRIIGKNKFIEVSFNGKTSDKKQKSFKNLTKKGFMIIFAIIKVSLTDKEAFLKSITWKEFMTMKKIEIEDI